MLPPPVRNRLPLKYHMAAHAHPDKAGVAGSASEPVLVWESMQGIHTSEPRPDRQPEQASQDRREEEPHQQPEP